MISLIIPMGFIRNIDSLAFTSSVSLLPMGYLLILQIYFLSSGGIASDIPAFRSDIFAALPIIIFSFSSQQALFPLYEEIKQQGRVSKHVRRVVNISIVSSGVIYAMAALLGFLQFPDTVDGNVMLSYPRGVAVDVLLFSMAISTILSYPVILYPCRFNVDKLVWGDKPLTYQRFVSVNIAIILVAFVVAVAVPSFATILQLFGSVTSTAIGFVLPSVFYLKLSPLTLRKDFRQVLAWALMVVGTVCGMISAVLTLYHYDPDDD